MVDFSINTTNMRASAAAVSQVSEVLEGLASVLHNWLAPAQSAFLGTKTGAAMDNLVLDLEAVAESIAQMSADIGGGLAAVADKVDALEGRLVSAIAVTVTPQPLPTPLDGSLPSNDGGHGRAE